MRTFDTLSTATIEEIATKLNKLNRKNIKIEYIERIQSHHPISVLYSYDKEKIELPISGS